MHRAVAVGVSWTLATLLALPAHGRPSPGRGRGARATPAEDAAAQEAAALKRKAQELLSEGNRLAQASEFVSALNKFRAAYELYPSPKLLLNIGTTQRQLGRWADAAASYEAFLASDEGDGPFAASARKALEEVGSLVGHLSLEVGEPDARVLLDGRTLTGDELAGPIRVDPGTHTVIAEKPGRPSTVRQIDVEAGESAELELPIAAPGEAPPEPVPVRPIAGYAVAGLGGAAIVVAVVLGVLAGEADGEARDQCAAGGEFAGYCSAEGARLTDKARDLGVAALVTGFAGAAVSIGGLTIALTTPSEPEATVPQTPAPEGSGPVVEHAGLVLGWRASW